MPQQKVDEHYTWKWKNDECWTRARTEQKISQISITINHIQ